MPPARPRLTVILGTRPEAIKLAPVIQGLRRVWKPESSPPFDTPPFDTKVVLTGQHREMVDQVMTLFGISAEVDLAIMQAHQSLTDITERSLRGLEAYFQTNPTDMVLVQGDTTTAFAATLAAFYQKIPVGHVEAGLRTADLLNPYPEEANRRLISQLASLHFAPTQQAVRNLAASGVVGSVVHTGNTVIDALQQIAQHPTPPPLPDLDWQQRVLLVTVHRRENWGEPLQKIIAACQELLALFPDTVLLLPMHRNPVVREPLQAGLGDHPRVCLTEPLDYPVLVAAMQRSTLILSDSGGIQEEAPALGKPVLVLRETTERPEAIAAGTARLVGTDPHQIVAIAQHLLKDPAAYNQMAQAVNPFGDGQATARILVALCQWFQLPLPCPIPPPLP